MTSLRIAFRTLLKSPGFVAVTLLTLALGIGVNTSMYTLVDVLLFRSVPFEEPGRLVSVLGTNPQNQRDQFSFAELEEARSQAAGPGRAFESLTTYTHWNNTLAEPGHPAERLLSIDATADFFTTFRVQPMLGRAYTADEEVPGKNQVAILSYSLWQSHFAGDRNVIGRSIRLNTEQVTVLGVMPPSFVAPLFFGPVDLWRPITIPRHIVEDRFNRFFQSIGRLNPGITQTQALAQLSPLAANWARDYPQTSKDRGFNLLPPHKAAMDSVSNFIVWFLFGVGAIVLLIGCANIANLQLARATSNAKDLAIRSALGASRIRLIMHQLTESMILAIAGGFCGMLLALWVNSIFGRAIRLGPDGDTLALPMNATILAGAFLISLVTGLIFGLLPAWFASRGDVVSTLKQQARGSTSSRGAQFLRQALVVGEVALALALLGAAGVMIRGFNSLLTRDKGWDTDRVLAANIHLAEQRGATYESDVQRRIAIDKLARRLKQIPGAENTAIATTAPLFGYSKVVPIQIEGQTSDDPAKQPNAGYTMIASDYFATLGIPLLEGRLFPEELTGESPPFVIINETMAHHFWPNETSIGRRIGDRQGEKIVWREVIGVVRDIQFALNITNPPTAFQVYKPMAQEPWGYMFLLVRGKNPAAFKNDVRRAVSDIDPDVAVDEMYTIPEAADRFQHNLVVINDVVAGFAFLGLVLASVGLYGVISNVVAQRTSEFGVRLALGAQPTNILTLVLGSGVKLTVIGLMIGGLAAFGINWSLASVMPRMAGSDPVTLVVVACVLFGVSVFACWWPARRATRVDPLEALRAE